MVQTFLGFEVIEARLKNLKSLGVKDLEFKIEDTPTCISNLRKAFYADKDKIEVFPDIAMVCFWCGDADGDPNSYTAIENGEEMVYHWNNMTAEQSGEFYSKRKEFAKAKGYIK